MTAAENTIAQDLLPVFDISDSVATLVRADRETTWEALMEVDLVAIGRSKPLYSLTVRRDLRGRSSPLRCGSRPRMSTRAGGFAATGLSGSGPARMYL